MTFLPLDGAMLQEYKVRAALTDRFSETELHAILLGLFGEVGSIMATAKKHKREGQAFISYRRDAEEEFGDALWYFTALCKRLGTDIVHVFSAAAGNGRDIISRPIVDSSPDRGQEGAQAPDAALDAVLLDLGTAAAQLLNITSRKDPSVERLVVFAECYLRAIHTAGLSFSVVVDANLAKTEGRFLKPNIATLPTFDAQYSADERIPDHFEIAIRERRSGQSCLQWNGVFIGDPLTDNIADPDGYRFHDVFHFAHAAVLHWSPTFRALIKHKRKSTPDIDEAQDSGRAIVVEEGLSAWVFSRAKLQNFFENQTSVSFDLLKGIRQFVSGYEVEECPLKLWEDAILQGYSVFRQVKAQNGGVIIGDRKARRIAYKSL